jgi:translation initiation factor 1
VVCKKCGLPEELCGCSTIARESTQNIVIKTERRKWGKEVTLIDGISDRDIPLNKLAKKLKGKLATGGTAKQGRIELQGNHLKRVKQLLVAEGFSESSIDVR